ncbi:MAG: transaldolase family protein [Anaerolineales bacterium]
MALFLQSAQAAEAQRAQALGFMEGITTTPALIAATGRPPLDVLGELVEIFDGHIFYQLVAPSLDARLDEAWEAYNVRPDRVIIKIPATIDNLSLIAKLPGVEVAMAGVYSAAQAYLAVQAEAHYVIPYIGHATQHLGDGLALVRVIRAVVEGSQTEIIAADMSTTDEALGALQAGAHHLALPLHLIEQMGNHHLTEQTIEASRPS